MQETTTSATSPTALFGGLQREPASTGFWHTKVPREEDDYTEKSAYGSHLMVSERQGDGEKEIRVEKGLSAGRGLGQGGSKKNHPGHRHLLAPAQRGLVPSSPL